MEEFIYYDQNKLEFPLSESIIVSDNLEALAQKKFIVSNKKEVDSEIYAPEIDFYIKNSQDPLPKQISNVEKLYELRAIQFDNAQDVTYTADISNRLLVVGEEEQCQPLFEKMGADEFDLYRIDPEIIQSVSGSIGNLSVDVKEQDKETTLHIEQLIWFDADERAFTQSGGFDPTLSSIDEVLSEVRANIESFEYRKFTVYDNTICQYHERREEICGKCEEVCPTTAIVKIDEAKHLEFSQIDCHGCGGCISVCPSGAIDYAPSNRDTLFEMSRLFKDTIALITPQKMALENLDITLKEHVLPFAIEGEKFLHEASLLTLLQESGAQVIFYSDFLSKGTNDSIKILNQIYQAKYGKDAVLIAMNEKELKEQLEVVSFIENSLLSYNQTNSRKRETFAVRLEKIVNGEDLGVVNTGEHVYYGKVVVNEDNCTLCLACVGACNVDALFARVEDNSLRFNASVCTSCGYCELSCPEKDCISIETDVIELNPTWFQERLLAKDTLFACVECGKEFATTKAVEKIAQMMGPLFAKDPIKERTLYCCESCKPKIMMQSYMDNKNRQLGQGV